nr:RHS repeat-associated core domain-containing protein [uncultured Roseateles sp.]
MMNRLTSRSGWGTALRYGLIAMLGVSAQAWADTVTRTVAWTYDAFGQLETETVEPEGDINTVRRAAVIVRDPGTGVPKVHRLQYRDPQTGQDVTRDVQTLGYDSRQRFVTLVTDAKGFQTTQQFDDGLGLKLLSTDANGLTTRWSFDAWGRPTSEMRPDGTSTTWAYRRCVDACPPHAQLVRIKQTWAGSVQSTAPEEDMFDALDRPVRGRRWGFDGTAIHIDREHDANGRLERQAAPRFASTTPVWTVMAYDDLGRTTRVERPSSTGQIDAETIGYDGLRTVKTDARGNVREETNNGLGKLARVRDALGFHTTYAYDGFANTVKVVDARGNEVRQVYDTAGRRTQLIDPDLGARTYLVNPLNQVYGQTDAKNQSVTFRFDELGRLTRRLSQDEDSRWDYDTAPGGIGRLAETYTWVNNAKDYRQVVRYDAAGRPARITTTLDQDYNAEYGYDVAGRLVSTTHRRSAVGATTGPYNTIARVYNANGHLAEIRRSSDGDAGGVLWTVQNQDARGQLKSGLLGNGVAVRKDYNPYTGLVESMTAGPGTSASLLNDSYDYDAIGNLVLRTQLAENGNRFVETFQYDSLNRLAGSQVEGRGLLTVDYDALGNIQARSGVGTYAYGASGAGSVRPHAVTSIATSGALAGSSQPSFQYDANGNQTAGLGRAIAWNSANQPVDIDRVENGVAVQRSSFVYGTQQQRVRQNIWSMNGGAPVALLRTRIYAGGIEKEIDAVAGITVIRTYVGDGAGYIEERLATAVAGPTASAPRQMRYYLTDRMGSVVAVVDDTQAVLQRMLYDAWGRRRAPDGSPETDATLAALKNQQDPTGFTGEEYLDNVALVHLNGRLYDPITGRMVSPDPTVPDPSDPQYFNRYAYVLNNPLFYADPTGFTADVIARLPTVVITATRSAWAAQQAATAYLSLQANSAAMMGAWAAGYGSFATWNNARTVGMVALRVLPLLGPVGVATVAGVVVVGAIILIANSKDPEESKVEAAPPQGESAASASASTPSPDGGDEDKQKKGRPKSNVEQNKQVNDAARETKLTAEQRRELGRAIEEESRGHGSNLGYKDIREIAELIKKGQY